MGVYAEISIHAPRVGRDSALRVMRTILFADFNPRAPCGARRVGRVWIMYRMRFQSTRPVWGATRLRLRLLTTSNHFNPRAPCGARPNRAAEIAAASNFNPRAPCGARQCSRRFRCRPSRNFNPRAPCGARPCLYWKNASMASHFNPRAPCGARLLAVRQKIWRWKFQSTRPVWGATFHRPSWPRRPLISIHAPRVGRDTFAAFSPDTPKISIHAPRVGRDHLWHFL